MSSSISETTVIHDEAALASTREQLQLLTRGRDIRREADRGRRPAAEPACRRRRTLGTHRTRDPRRGRAGGADPQPTRPRPAQTAATKPGSATARSNSPIRGYAARDRVHLEDDRQSAEDRALEAAHEDRLAGKRTIVIAQTSNDHLDELNARAQAIRHQDGELGEEGVPVPGRPYELHAGDLVQIRHTITLPEHQLRNGTGGEVEDVNPASGEVTLRLHDDQIIVLDAGQVSDGDLRLAYVQHPFPAQGHTTDTAHVIVGDHATREGTYVGITRAREQTNIYAEDGGGSSESPDRLPRLAERLGRLEPELPSIRIPLAHENAVTRTIEREHGHEIARQDLTVEHEPQSELERLEHQPPDATRLWPEREHDQPEQVTRDRVRDRSIGYEM